MRLNFQAAAAALLILPVHASTSLQDETPARQRAASIEDLPAREYTLSMPMAELLASHATLVELATAVASDINDVFARYEIVDATLEHDLAQAAMHAALLSEEWDDARRFLTQVRSLEEREDLKVIGGLHWEAWIAVRRASDADLDALRGPFATELRALADAQPWELTRHELGMRAAKTGMLGRGLLDMVIRSTLGDAASNGGLVDASTAQSFLKLANGVHVLLPLKGEVTSVYRSYLAANEKTLVDVWAQRELTLEATEMLTPVRIAVWDTGVDVAIFRDQLWANPGETADGIDNDGNGFIDDLHGFGFGPDLRQTAELLYPRHPDDAVWKRVRSYDSALSDLTASIDSPESRRLQHAMTSMDGDEAATFVNELMHYAVHSHGTHVAGIALDGNPFARLVVARVGLDHREPGERKTLAWAHRFAAMCHDSATYFRAANVRVVNISWGWGVAEIEENLRATRDVGTDEELRKRARAIHAVVATGIEAAIASAPHILFVCGAGNSGDDSSNDRFVPSSLHLPNLVTIGGVDSACGMTAFTSFGDHVQLYANGYHVESFVPGGERRPQSGTSMSAPQAANLAAKLLAIDQNLSPERLVDLMRRGAERTRLAESEVLVLDPKGTVALLEGRTRD